MLARILEIINYRPTDEAGKQTPHPVDNTTYTFHREVSKNVFERIFIPSTRTGDIQALEEIERRKIFANVGKIHYDGIFDMKCDSSLIMNSRE